MAPPWAQSPDNGTASRSIHGAPEGRAGHQPPWQSVSSAFSPKPPNNAPVISCILGPLTPLNLGNQADLHDSNQLPDTWHCNVITPFTKMQKELLEAFLIRVDIIPLMGQRIHQSCCYDYGDGGETTLACFWPFPKHPRKRAAFVRVAPTECLLPALEGPAAGIAPVAGSSLCFLSSCWGFLVPWLGMT